MRNTTMRAGLGLLTAVGAIVVAGACSSESTALLAPFTVCRGSGPVVGMQDDCTRCVSSQCAPAGNAFETQCVDYLSCVCTDGQAPGSAALAQCASKLSEASCAQAVGALKTCEERSCATECRSLADGGGDGDAGPVSDAAADGQDGAGTVTVSCSNGSGALMECDQQQVPPSAVPLAQTGCTQVGGAPGGTCPTQGLAGCCRLPTTENCYYDMSAVSQRQTTCASAGGSWAATP